MRNVSYQLAYSIDNSKSHEKETFLSSLPRPLLSGNWTLQNLLTSFTSVALKKKLKNMHALWFPPPTRVWLFGVEFKALVKKIFLLISCIFSSCLWWREILVVMRNHKNTKVAKKIHSLSLMWQTIRRC